MENKIFGLAIGGALMGVAALGTSIASYNRSRKAAENIGRTVKELEEGDAIDISDAILEKACNDAADRAISEGKQKIVCDGKARLRAQIDKMVTDEADSIQIGLANKLSERVDKIDVEALANDIRQKVAEKMADEVFEKMKSTMYPSEKNSMTELFKTISSLDNDWDKRVLLESAIDKIGR